MCQSGSQTDIATELRLARTILERLECSFARQEAKLDQLLSRMATTQAAELPTFQRSQFHQQPVQTLPTMQQLSTPMPPSGPCQSLEYATPVLYQRTPLSDGLPDLDRLLDETDLAGNNGLNLFILKLLDNCWVSFLHDSEIINAC